MLTGEISIRPVEVIHMLPATTYLLDTIRPGVVGVGKVGLPTTRTERYNVGKHNP